MKPATLIWTRRTGYGRLFSCEAVIIADWRRLSLWSRRGAIRRREETGEQISPLLTRLIRRLPVDEQNGDERAVVELEESIVTPAGRYAILLRGEAENVVNQTLGATATRLSWFVIAVMAAIALAWLAIEIGIVRRVTRLSQRAPAFFPVDGAGRRLLVLRAD